MVEYNRYPAMDADNNFPPGVRQALSASPEISYAINNQVSPLVREAMTDDPNIAAAGAEAAKEAVDTKLKEANVFTGVEDIANVEDLAVSFTDSEGRRMWIEADLRGRPSAHSKKILTEDLTPSVLASVKEELDIKDIDSTILGWAAVFTDSNDKILGGWKKDGVFKTTEIELPKNSVALTNLSSDVKDQLQTSKSTPLTIDTPDGLLTTSMNSSGNWELRINDAQTGVSRKLHTAKDIRSVSLSSDKTVVFFTDQSIDGAESTAKFVKLSGGTAARVLPHKGLAAFGDSMTEGMGGGYGVFAWPAVCATELNIPFYNGGISAQTSTEIAIRQGGVAPALTVTGGSIPASGPVAVTVTDPTTTYRTTWEWQWVGTLSGIPGVLSKSKTEEWSFTRTTAGSAKVVADGTRFISAPGELHSDWIQVLWTGRNNPQKATVLRDTASMVSKIKPLQKQFLVLSVCRSSSEGKGTNGYTNINSINAELASTYGPNYHDILTYLVNSALSDSGITPTAQDLTDISNEVIPTSLRADGTHLNAAGYNVLGKYIASVLRQKGWV